MNRIQEKSKKMTTISKSLNSQKISCRLDKELLIKCQNFIRNQHSNGNYDFSSTSDLVRKSLIAYQEGMTLNGTRNLTNQRQEITFRLNEELNQFYQQLPAGSRTEILERSLITYLNTLQ